jgi:hypothetical protein
MIAGNFGKHLETIDYSGDSSSTDFHWGRSFTGAQRALRDLRGKAV